MQFERVHRGNVTAVLLALAVLAASCKRVPLHDASAQVYLEIAQALDQPMVVPDTIDLASNPAYYEKYHIPEPAKMVACFYDPTTHALVDKEYVGPYGGHINELSPGTYDLMVYVDPDKYEDAQMVYGAFVEALEGLAKVRKQNITKKLIIMEIQ